ncbi:MAPEG family protein [Chelatococcus reniformis]|uniref:MAPEG family protein n=1 Tax=Chelatococcus reniformis TaxID=1494448 RepID=A0A916XM48_9HYPH|nr:MAPEG family protein [Chelatococcus reniformis]GGC85570.1 hypothetical protein GCM10010994_49340 [Chelatococcus reniformis]
MTVQAVLLPVFVLVALTFALLIGLMLVRGRAMKGGDVRVGEVALDADRWPEDSRKFNNAYDNVLTLPVLFYALVILALVTRKADFLFVAMEWIYVAARAVQMGVHVTTNTVPLRGAAFAVSTVVLGIMWIIFAVRILVSYGP